jgi:TolB-like protein/DNA-binding winged helix-turn-helix (wHTH) protein/Tfp pilus assembly protein PilF
MGDSNQKNSRVVFRPFEAILSERELYKGGKPLHLQDQPFRLLAMLLERPGELISREEVRRRLWPDGHFVDFNEGIDTAVRKLRYVLGDSATNPRFIETVPRHGYRFIAPIECAPAEPAVAAVALPHPDKDPSRWKLAAVSGAIACIVLVAGLIVWRTRRSGSESSTPGAAVNRIGALAVLPLEELSSDRSQDYFADGMTDELITSLGQIDSLRVISRTSVMQYKGTRKPLPQIARELKVDAVVEGTVVRSGDQVRITAQLIRVRDEKHLWAQNYQGDVRDVLGLQNQIAGAIAKQIRLTLSPNDRIRSGIERPINVQAYESYLKGEYLLNRFTSKSIEKAADLFHLAIQQDPSYVPAYVKLAGSYQILANMDALPKKVAYEKANPLIAKALELDPHFAAAHAVHGWRFLEYELNFAEAGAEFKRAVELNPNGVEGHEGLATYYQTMGQLHESVQEMERARELDPLALIVNTDLCRSLYFARRYDEALAQCKADIDLDPNAPRTFWFLGDVYAAKGADSEAVASFLHALQLTGAPPAMVSAATNGAKDSGVKGFWRALVQFLPKNTSTGIVDPFEAAISYAYAGDADKTLMWLRQAVEDRSFGITYLGVNPTFDDLRSDQRFASLLRQMGLPFARPPLPSS